MTSDEQRQIDPTVIRRVLEAFLACGVDTDQIEAITDAHVDEVARFLATGLKPWQDDD